MSLWQRKDLQQAAGPALRPGGLELTRRSLALGKQHRLLAQGARVLDLGCGTGATLQLLQKEGYRAFGLDRKPALVDAAQVIRADVARPPIIDKAMDALICECVLSLLHRPLAALRQWHRALRPDGILLLTEFYLRRDGAAASRGLVPDVQNDRSCRAPNCPENLPATVSCLDGARTAPAWNALLAQAGFTLRVFEDHSEQLGKLAARLIWYGQEDLPGAFGLSQPYRSCQARHGYGLWIAQKGE
jgi:SAM-dependent methyltransferase